MTPALRLLEAADAAGAAGITSIEVIEVLECTATDAWRMISNLVEADFLRRLPGMEGRRRRYAITSFGRERLRAKRPLSGMTVAASSPRWVNRPNRVVKRGGQCITICPPYPGNLKYQVGEHEVVVGAGFAAAGIGRYLDAKSP